MEYTKEMSFCHITYLELRVIGSKLGAYILYISINLTRKFMAFIKQKETRYVIERIGSMSSDVYRVVDTLEEVQTIVGTVDEDDDSFDDWTDFLAGKKHVVTCGDYSWKITRCGKSE